MVWVHRRIHRKIQHGRMTTVVSRQLTQGFHHPLTPRLKALPGRLAEKQAEKSREFRPHWRSPAHEAEFPNSGINSAGCALSSSMKIRTDQRRLGETAGPFADWASGEFEASPSAMKVRSCLSTKVARERLFRRVQLSDDPICMEPTVALCCLTRRLSGASGLSRVVGNNRDILGSDEACGGTARDRDCHRRSLRRVPILLA